MQAKTEDRTFGGNTPYIDLTPLNLWGDENKVARHIGKKNWESVRSHIVSRVQNTCELCGASPKIAGVIGRRSNKFDVEFRFEHDYARKVATLRRLIHVCVPCYQSIHLRQTQIKSARMPPDRSPMIGAIARLEHFHGKDPIEIERWLHTELAQWERRKEDGYPNEFDFDIIENGIDRMWR